MNLSEILLFLLLLTSPAFAQDKVYQEEPFKVSVPLGKPYDYSRILVTRVIDGNTLLLENGERVVLIGIEAPEKRTNSKARRQSIKQGKPLRIIKIMGRRSAKFVRDRTEGRDVRLEFDVKQKDEFGRLLAYVYIGDTFLNAEIIKQGYAAAVSDPPNVKYDELFQKLYDEAQKRKTRPLEAAI